MAIKRGNCEKWGCALNVLQEEKKYGKSGQVVKNGDVDKAKWGNCEEVGYSY